MGVYEGVRETLCCVTPPSSVPSPGLFAPRGASPGWLPILWARKEVTGEIVVPGVSEVKLVEKVARKRQEMLPARPQLALAKWEPWNLGVWDRRPSPEETQIIPRKARSPPTPSHKPSGSVPLSALERPALFTGDKFH